MTNDTKVSELTVGQLKAIIKAANKKPPVKKAPAKKAAKKAVVKKPAKKG